MSCPSRLAVVIATREDSLAAGWTTDLASWRSEWANATQLQVDAAGHVAFSSRRKPLRNPSGLAPHARP